VLDPTLLRAVNVTAGLKDSGSLIINTRKDFDTIEQAFGSKWKLALVDGTRIAREILGVNIVNTTMLGALLKTTPVVEVESLVEPLKERFGRLAERNLDALKRALLETRIKE
jgi:pyruvate ferredoxin oxidoreductase gamma subunit